MNLISKSLHYIGNNIKNIFVVQIGAMDGINFDDTREYLDKYQWDALLVEPIPEIFNKLKNNFKDRTNYIFEQCAIGNHDGQIEMLTVPLDVIEKEGLHPGFMGVSTQYPPKNGFGYDFQNDIDVKNKFGVSVIVPCLTLDTLLKKHNLSKVDIFICDAEGYDWEIFKNFDFVNYHPYFIRLEYINLTNSEKDLIKNKLEQNGYVVEIDDNIDAVLHSIWNKININQIIPQPIINPLENNAFSNIKNEKSNETLPKIKSETQIDKEEENVTYYIEKYGSNKKISNYNKLYDQLFINLKSKVNTLLEIGIGSVNSQYEFSIPDIFEYYPQYKPGGSLRAWRDYFEKAYIYGVDIDPACQFEENRITTYIFDSRDINKCDEHFTPLSFDIIIDDGNHTGEAQLQTLKNLFPYLANNGLYIIENCIGDSDSHIFLKYHEELIEIISEHEYYYKGDIIFIRKSGNKQGELKHFEDFIKSGTIKEEINVTNKLLTVVTGLWNINRPGRDFSHYIDHFKRFLEIPVNMFIYIPEEYEYLIWEVRSKENTFVKIANLDYINKMYSPFWDKTQDIRTDPNWFNQTGENGWLASSPQATLEYYNPIVQSKMFLLNDASIWNPFDTEYFIWLDAGITSTVYEKLFTDKRALDKIIPYLDDFLFLSYPYAATDEIHGFDFEAINRYAGDTVKYVCRGGLFGGRKEIIHMANSTYYATLYQTLNDGYMGTEESIFAIMAYREPDIYRRYSLDENGLIGKFIDALINDDVKLESIPKQKKLIISNNELAKYKTNLYILTFNFPQQLQHTINTMEKIPEWLNKPHIVLIDNSTKSEAIEGNKAIAEKYKMEYILMGDNTGICGGRQKAAEHFHDSDADFMFFFEDDMTINPPELLGEFCRNGFRKYVPNLYTLVHKIMLREKFDFLKLSFTEVYFDNDKSLPWYNVPQSVRDRDWPDYNQLPISGLDPNSPLAKYQYIKNYEGLCYLIGDVNYANWPMIVSKEGNKKIFIDTKWAHPYEQTWSSHVYNLMKDGILSAGILLASPIWHDRIIWYEPEERREN